MVLAYLAGVTTSIRLGSAVAVLPFHNPIQLAEQAATVDLLSNGCLELGVGRSYQWGEFHKFNIPMEEATLGRTPPVQRCGALWIKNALTSSYAYAGS